MMKGYLGFTHYGHPCFDRIQYEDSHLGESELERLEDALGMSFASFEDAVYHAYAYAPYLLYRLESDELDAALLKGRDKWMRHRGGFVHVVTGEYVVGSVMPDCDSYPSWKKEEPASRWMEPYSALRLSGLFGIAAMAIGMAATILGGERK